MPAQPTNVTPTPVSVSMQVTLTEDTVTGWYGPITPTFTTSSVATTSLTNQFSATTIYKDSYAVPVVTSSAYLSNTSQTYTILRAQYSAPIILVSVTQYHQINSTNTTVFNALNSPSSLLLTSAGSGDDVVSFKNAVVSSSTA